MRTQQQVIDSLPQHLRPFVAKQDYDSYTPRDQAIWRFLMHQLVENLTNTAHPLYLQGLKGTGISVEYIPKIEEMNANLEKIGWRAAVVDGFIPPAIFIEFLAHRVLVVAVDIRSIDHMLYTPAPDIIHESAGHAPFIIDVDYAEYLERVGDFGRRVISDRGDIETYEAIRALSIVKESPKATQEDIDKAEKVLSDCIEKYKDTKPSESTLLSRLQWWTTEYGLVGEPNDYKIYGAGLLSSLGESVNCLDDDKVKKIPLTIDAIATTYDITREQPQLFVAKNCRHLSQIAEEFAKSTCFYKGGTESIQTAIDAQTVNTAVYNSGLEVSGQFTAMRTDATGTATYINTTGPTQLSYKEKQMRGHGTDRHPHGFGSPVGKVQAMDKCLSSYSIDDLKLFDIEVGKRATLEFLSGIRVEGLLMSIYRRDGKNLLFTFDECTVTALNGDVLFDPEWGEYDMAVGQEIVSVYGGSADQSAFPLYKQPSNTATVSIDYDEQTKTLFSLYKRVRDLRQSEQTDVKMVEQLCQDIQQSGHDEWLLLFELAELCHHTGVEHQSIKQQLIAKRETASGQTVQLLDYALNRMNTWEH
ncbi:aromatic amino acid hydroxylase [Aestuariibacter salexigens]|uniref:aromatic amino acid hydroxylase n=1 Tax=Aestuariibacter salexigens TaxID=226010 RepID=UPI0003F6D7F8|nr:aromatic amino acid hydroxylase [Aestuariibacter salexigens]